MQNITYGLPQGSILGPKLFLLYINDICKVCKNLQFVLFADDTNIFCSRKDINQLLNTVEAELKTLKRWFDVNKLSLNLQKTKFIVFSNMEINHPVEIAINGIQLEQVKENSFLGVIIDNKLCWKPHVAHVKSKMYKSLGILQKLKYEVHTKP